jgi:Cys-tRNA(Pro)/Cys-tRNA(Cys) deacylase
MFPDAVQRVADFLRDARAEATIEEFPQGTPTAEAAARAAGVEPARIVKSLLFLCDDRPVLVLVPGDRRADAEKIGRVVDAPRCRVATREEVLAATGFAPGAVAPFPVGRGTAVLIDQTLLAHESVWVGAGSPKHMARLRPGELLRLSNARAMDAVADGTYHSG